MTTATPGTIPALPPYQPGALPLVGTEAFEIVSTTDPATAASYYLPLDEAVGKIAGVMNSTVPALDDLCVGYRPGSGEFFSVLFGNIPVTAGNLPIGGLTAQLLIKINATNFVAGWDYINILINPTLPLVTSGTGVMTITIGTSQITSTYIGPGAVTSVKIANNAVGNAQFRQSAGLSVVGLAGTTVGNVADITANIFATGQFLVNLNGTSLVWTAAVNALAGPLRFTTVGANAVIVGGATTTSTLTFVSPAIAGRVFMDLGGGSQPAFVAFAGDVTVTSGGTTTLGSGKATATMPYSANGTSVTWSGAPVLATSLVVGTTIAPAVVTGSIVANAMFYGLNSFKRVSGNFSVTSTTTLQNITGLSVALLTSGSYAFQARLFATAGSTGGSKVAMAFSGTLTTGIYDVSAWNTTLLTEAYTTTFGTANTISTSAVAPFITLQGFVTALTAGNLTVQVAQQAATTTATQVLTGSYMQVWQLT